MEIATIKGESRGKSNRQALKNLRNAGKLPGVIYGHGKAAESIALDKHDLELALSAGKYVINLEVDGAPTQYLLKDVQYDHLQRYPIHVDLIRVDPNEKVTVRVPLEFRGQPKGVRDGGVFMHALTDLEVECKLTDIPESIRIDVEHLDMNDAVYVRDLDLPEGVQSMVEENALVANVTAKRGTQAEEEAAEDAAAEAGALSEPEVIGRTAKEDDADQESK
jgi:large subunit ribosomal protein L25